MLRQHYLNLGALAIFVRILKEFANIDHLNLGGLKLILIQKMKHLDLYCAACEVRNNLHLQQTY